MLHHRRNVARLKQIKMTKTKSNSDLKKQMDTAQAATGALFIELVQRENVDTYLVYDKPVPRINNMVVVVTHINYQMIRLMQAMDTLHGSLATVYAGGEDEMYIVF